MTVQIGGDDVAMNAKFLHADFGVLVARGTLTAGWTRDGRGLASSFDGRDEPLGPRRGTALGPARRTHGRNARMFRTPGGEVEEQLVVEHFEDGQVDSLRFFFTPMPKFLDDGEGLGREQRGRLL